MQFLVFLSASTAAALYAGGSLQIKKGMQAGVNVLSTVAMANYAMFLWSVPLLFLFPGPFVLQSLVIAMVAGTALFVGRIFSVLALDSGDLSTIGPLLGLKTLLVACFSFLSGQSEMNAGLWEAALLVTIGVILLQKGPKKTSGHRVKGALFALAASVLFAGCDILVVQARGTLGVGWLSLTLFGTVAVLTPFLGLNAMPSKTSNRKTVIGSTILGFQTTLIVLLIGLTGAAVMINIVYSTRSLWTVLVDRFFGRGEGVAEYFAIRMIGAVFVLAAIIIVMFQR